MHSELTDGVGRQLGANGTGRWTGVPQVRALSGSLRNPGLLGTEGGALGVVRPLMALALEGGLESGPTFNLAGP